MPERAQTLQPRANVKTSDPTSSADPHKMETPVNPDGATDQAAAFREEEEKAMLAHAKATTLTAPNDDSKKKKRSRITKNELQGQVRLLRNALKATESSLSEKVSVCDSENEIEAEPPNKRRIREKESDEQNEHTRVLETGSAPVRQNGGASVSTPPEASNEAAIGAVDELVSFLKEKIAECVSPPASTPAVAGGVCSVKSTLESLGFGHWDVSQWPTVRQINFSKEHPKGGVFYAADVRDRLFWPDTAVRVTDESEFLTDALKDGKAPFFWRVVP